MLALTTKATGTPTWSAWTSARCRRAPWWSGSATARGRHRGQRVRPRRDRPAAGRAWRAAAGLGAAGSWRLHRSDGRRHPGRNRDAGIDPGQVIGVATDFTASTCLPVLADGTPLCQLPGLAARPHAYPKLWKHHAAQPHADRINATARERHEKWINRYGGKISSEWQFAKALQLLDEDYELYQRADRWIEAADWIIWQLCGTETRNACTAGYKGIYQDSQYPSREFLAVLDPRFAGFATDKLAHPISALGGLARADPGRGRDVRPAGWHRGGCGQRGRARHRARRGPGRGGQDGGHHGHLDLPRDERRRAGRGARHVRRGGRRDRGQAVGLRGGPERGGRHLRLVRPQRRAGRVRRRRAAARDAAAAAARREGHRGAAGSARAGRAGLGRRQPFGAGRRPACPAPS